MKESFLVIGSGSWGTALAMVLARNEHPVALWGIDTDALVKMQSARENSTYLPGIKFPESLHAVTDLKIALDQAQHVLVVVPSEAFEEVIQEITPALKKKQGLIWATKGLSKEGHLLHELAQKYLGKDFPLAILSGPSFAKEVAENLPTAVLIASNNKKYAEHMKEAFKTERFRIYLSSDIIGTEIGGAVKNVLALAVGMAQGLNFGTNTKAALITRGLAEMMRLGDALGAKRETLTGLSGLGDLILTCSDLKSRNLRFGTLIGQGVKKEEALQKIGQVVEGLGTTKLVHQLAQKHKVRMPISEKIYQLLYENLSPQTAIAHLLDSDADKE